MVKDMNPRDTMDFVVWMMRKHRENPLEVPLQFIQQFGVYFTDYLRECGVNPENDPNFMVGVKVPTR